MLLVHSFVVVAFPVHIAVPIGEPDWAPITLHPIKLQALTRLSSMILLYREKLDLTVPCKLATGLGKNARQSGCAV